MYRFLAVLFLVLCSFLPARQALAVTPYAIGNPLVQELWIDPVNGDDMQNGLTRNQSLRTVRAAWNRIPLNTTLLQGFRLQLLPGQHQDVPAYWESRWGTAAAPILLNAVDGAGSAIFPAATFFDVRYLYVIGIQFRGGDGGDGLQCERCDHFLLRNVTVNGNFTHPRGVQEGVKINQSQHVYIEDSDISGAGDNAIDMVAVQYGHVSGNRVHDSEDWCMYLKGGSSDMVVEANIFHTCGTGGFTAGQGTSST